MEKEKITHIAYNTHRVIAILLLIAFLAMGISSLWAEDIWLGIGFLVCGLLPLFFLAISPKYYVFSDTEVIIVYYFALSEQIRWDSIRSITRCGGWIGGGGLPHYELAYPYEKERPFFVCGEIAKTRKTEQLLKKHFPGEIR